MLPMIDLVFIVVLLALVFYWWDARRCHEIVVQHCQRECKKSELQLLDSTVSSQGLWLRRNEKGQLELCRLYAFEFCSDSESRHQGYVVLLGRHIAETSMDTWRLPHH